MRTEVLTFITQAALVVTIVAQQVILNVHRKWLLLLSQRLTAMEKERHDSFRAHVSEVITAVNAAREADDG